MKHLQIINPNIKGFKFGDIELKISQLADDTTLILRDVKSIEYVKQILHNFFLHSGLKTNIDKTQAFILGKHKKRIKDTYGLKWCDGPISMLGLYICENEIDNYNYNFSPRIKKIRNILKMWKQRSLSLKGKMVIINTLVSPILVYPCTALDTPDLAVKEIDKIFFDFLRNGKTSKISKSTVIQQLENYNSIKDV